MFKPLNDCVVIEPVKLKPTGRLILNESATDKQYGLRARVVAVGPGTFTLTGERVPMGVKEGDIVLVEPGSIHLFNEGEGTYAVIQERRILAVVETKMPYEVYNPALNTGPKVIESIPLAPVR